MSGVMRRWDLASKRANTPEKKTLGQRQSPRRKYLTLKTSACLFWMSRKGHTQG